MAEGLDLHTPANVIESSVGERYRVKGVDHLLGPGQVTLKTAA